MLKRNWRNNWLFCHVFVIGEISIGDGGGGRATPLGYAYAPIEENKKRCSQTFREVSGVFQQNFNGSKISAFLEPRTGQFSRTWGFEAKAKDLTFEAKDSTSVITILHV